MENTNVIEKKENKIKKLWNYFSLYEKIWFFSIVVLTIVFAFVFPEDSEELLINPTLIMGLYILDIISNVTCELLIAKQSKWNFIVSLIVELVEIAICIVCAYRWVTCAVTIFFWIPIDIISFISWNKHKDKEDENVTEVRKLNWWQNLILIGGIAVWTVVVGYLLSLIDYEGILSYSEVVQDVGGYLDACASAVGIANGVFILLRYREQWAAWYIVTFIEIALNIMAGQWILLILKVGYLTNTTYGYIKWTQYIKNKKQEIVNGKKGDDNLGDDKDTTDVVTIESESNTETTQNNAENLA